MAAADKKTCFVVMGFGAKTDFRQQKTFDLDKTYRNIIKPSVEAAGLTCVRADDIIHSGVIDKPMYEQLLHADVVIADLSTSNENAIYELGVRHALRPRTTIVLAEHGFSFPFDVNHVLIRTYEHMGGGIDFDEVERMRSDLRTALETLVDQPDDDSPVYVFLPGLTPPTFADDGADADGPGANPIGDDGPFSSEMERFRTARAAENWASALEALDRLREMRPGDPFLVQQAALVTYKGKQPDVATSLANAKALLAELDPESSNDSETLGLWGAIHKRLWEENRDPADLDESIRSYGKGFVLRDDHYNGINYAFMLDARAAEGSGDDAIADRVWAKRVRLRVIERAEEVLERGILDDDGKPEPEEMFWVRATLVEAYTGTGQHDAAAAIRKYALGEAPEPWMGQTLDDQLGKLTDLMSVSD